jgi:cell division protein FtsW
MRIRPQLWSRHKKENPAVVFFQSPSVPEVRREGVSIHRLPPADNLAAIRRGPIDSWLLFAVILLVLVGEIMVFNTTYFYAFERFNDPYRFVWKHQLALLLGGLGLVAATVTPSAVYRRVAYPLLAFALCGLLIVFLPGVTHGKVHRWIALGPLNFQPSELAKGAVALYLAHSLTKKTDRIASLLQGLLPHLLVIGLVVGLIALEPDLGGAAVISLLLFALLFICGARKEHMGTLAVAGIFLLVIGIFTASYRSLRILSFLNPAAYRQGAGYQLVQSLLAFGAGGVCGVGLGESRQKMFFLPEAHTDFIFAVIGEETGLLGTIGVLSLFILLGLRGLRIAARHPHPFGSRLAFACTFLLVCQAGLNMAVVLGMLPTKGLPLPFISYGGSALIMALIYTGVLLSLSREARRENQVYV